MSFKFEFGLNPSQGVPEPQELQRAFDDPAEEPIDRLLRAEVFDYNKHIANTTAAHFGLAHTMFEALSEELRLFQESLETDEEIGAVLSNFGTSITISVHGIGYRNPHLMVFTGETADGQLVDLVQHTSQVNLLLTRLKVTSRKPHRIGFGVEPETANDEQR